MEKGYSWRSLVEKGCCWRGFMEKGYSWRSLVEKGCCWRGFIEKGYCWRGFLEKGYRWRGYGDRGSWIVQSKYKVSPLKILVDGRVKLKV